MKKEDKYDFGNSLYYPITDITGRTYALGNIVSSIVNEVDESNILHLVDQYVLYGEIVEADTIFAGYGFSMIVGSTAMKDHQKEKSMHQVKGMLSDIYWKDPDKFENFNRIFYKTVLRFISMPFTCKSKNDDKKMVHVMQHGNFDHVLDRMLEGGYPFFKYAEQGFINLAQSTLVDSKYQDDLNYGEAPMELLAKGCLGDAPYALECLPELLDYHLNRFKFFDKIKYRKKCLAEIKNLCDKYQSCREFFLEYYERHTEMFDKAFLEFPEYIFIVQGKYQRYEVAMELSEKLHLTMQDFMHEEQFFAGKHSSAEDKASKNDAKTGKHEYAFGMRTHQVKLIKALDRFTRKLISKGVDYQIINFWPNQTLEKKTTLPVGPYVAVAFEKDSKWYLLIDGIYDRCAIYIWEGESLNEGLDIFKINKSYARGQKNVKHHNHQGTIEDYDVTYQRILSFI